MWSKQQQLKVLVNAFQLASFLNRTLILPKFICGVEYCNLMGRFPGCVRFLDETLGTNYREHMFLQNPLVPESVRISVTKLISITDNTKRSTEVKPYLSNIKIIASKYQEFSVLNVSIEESVNLVFNKTLELQLQEVFNMTKCLKYYYNKLA